MEVKWGYSKSQLEAAVRFISAHNDSFTGQEEHIRNSLLDAAKRLVNQFPDSNWLSTMGFHVSASIDDIESMDSDENEVFIEFWVDPALGTKNWNDGDYFFETVNVKKT